ncbi:MAG: hypothetical protein JXA35_06855 [Deltaproteobacteria bacterium]|nr:hypothetical protein [Deltaproteobacteria bacterium]
MEILIIVLIIAVIFLLPRMLRRPPEPEVRPLIKIRKLNGWQRLAIVASFLWLSFFTIYLKPWNNDWRLYFYTGIAPVILFWGIFWIFLGFKNKGK